MRRCVGKAGLWHPAQVRPAWPPRATLGAYSNYCSRIICIPREFQSENGCFVKKSKGRVTVVALGKASPQVLSMGACESNTVPVQVDETVKVKEVQIPTPVPCPAKAQAVETKKVVVDDIKPSNSPRRRPNPAFKMNAAQRKAAAWKQRVAEGIAGKFTQMKLAELEANEKKEKAEWSSSDGEEDANNNNVDARTNRHARRAGGNINLAVWISWHCLAWSHP